MKNGNVIAAARMLLRRWQIARGSSALHDIDKPLSSVYAVSCVLLYCLG